MHLNIIIVRKNIIIHRYAMSQSLMYILNPPWNVEGMHSIYLIHGLPNKILYWIVFPLITCDKVLATLTPTVICNTTYPKVWHKVSLKALSYKNYAARYESRTPNFCNVTKEIMLITKPLSIRTLLKGFSSTSTMICKGVFFPPWP